MNAKPLFRRAEGPSPINPTEKEKHAFLSFITPGNPTIILFLKHLEDLFEIDKRSKYGLHLVENNLYKSNPDHAQKLISLEMDRVNCFLKLTALSLGMLSYRDDKDTSDMTFENVEHIFPLFVSFYNEVIVKRTLLNLVFVDDLYMALYSVMNVVR